jgi:CrcB protein
MGLALAIAALGGTAAAFRYLMDQEMAKRFGRRIPWGTITINILGSGLAGLLVGASIYSGLGSTTKVLLLTGLLGGFTTASTFSYEVAELLRERRYTAGVAVAVGTMSVALVAGIAGLALGSI